MTFSDTAARLTIQVIARNDLRDPRLNSDGAVVVHNKPSISNKRLVLQVLVFGVTGLEGMVCCLNMVLKRRSTCHHSDRD